jgi:GNAT superfamily N-acetyltransferase
MNRETVRAVERLCRAAYGENLQSYLAGIGPGDHLLGRVDGALVSHLMWVTRRLEPRGQAPLRTAYVELVATAPEHQRRGYASALLTRFVTHVGDSDLAALSPATAGIYARLGWKFWRGPLAVRRGGQLRPTPEDRVMILPLPRTPALDLDVPLSVEWRQGEVW